MYVIFTINMVYAIKYMLIQFDFAMLCSGDGFRICSVII